MRRLTEIASRIVCNRIHHYLRPYFGVDLPLEERPSFGDLALCSAEVSQILIEYLIGKGYLQTLHLKVLLEKNVVFLPCYEYMYYSPFTTDTLNVISRRCPNFREIHYHWNLVKRKIPNYPSLVELINESLMRLSKSLTVLDFTDASVDSSTLRVISYHLTSLRILTLHHSLIEEGGEDHLIHPNSVIKPILEGLTIDKTFLPAPFVAECLVQYTNLEYFRSDCTIEAYLYLENSGRSLPKFFKTTILTNIFRCSRDISCSKNIALRFPYVNHAIFILASRSVTPFVNNLILMMNITKLELSCLNYFDFIELKQVFDSDKFCFNLDSLTIECFLYVDIFFLGERCTNLKKLTLINNTYNKAYKEFREQLFNNLKEFEIMFLSDVDQLPGSLENYYMDFHTLLAIMSSKQLEIMVFVNQKYFGKALLITLSLQNLRNLKELYFFTCKLEIQVLISLFQTGVPIKRLEYNSDSVKPKVTELLNKFIKENNYDVLVIQIDNFPYWLRFSTVRLQKFKKYQKFGSP